MTVHGIALSHWSEREAEGHTDPGWWLAYRRPAGGWYFPTVYDDNKAESTMAKIEKAMGFRETRLTGFTLFQNVKGWQMSVRRKDEHGWDVKIVPDVDAQVILSMLEASGHPDGPITIRADGSALKRALAAAEAAREAMTAVLRSKGAP